MSTVLVVHAEASVGQSFADAITGAGHHTCVVTSGEHAMDQFVQEPADVVVLDLQLRGRDGLKAAEAIRWMPGGRRARVVLTAAREPEGVTLEELGRGVDAFAVLVGPPDPARLLALVEEAARVRPEEAETRVLTVEQAMLTAERAKHGGEEESTATPSGDAFGLAFDDETVDEPAPAEWEWSDPDGRVEGREVRALAQEAERGQSELVGSFEKVAFARLLHRMARKRASGALICVHPPDERETTEGTEPTKVVYFRAGVPVHVRSNLVRECLGQVLVRQRKIGPATLRESLSAVERGEGRQGEVLVAMGALGALDLSEGLAEQLRLKLFDLFGWQRGTFRFASRPPPVELIDIGLGLAEIAYLGVREGMAPARVLERLTPQRDRYVVPQPRELVRFVRLHVPPSLRGLVGAIDGSRTVRELLERSGDPAGAAQLLYAMSCLEAVRFTPTRLGARPASAQPPLPATSPERPSPKGGAPLPSDVPEPGPEPAEAEPSAPSEEDAAVLDARVERQLAAERHFRRGQNALNRDRWAEAIDALARAAELCPDEGRFLVHLAWAKHASAPDDEAMLEEALELAERGCALAPDVTVAHLLSARLLRSAGREQAARAALERVLALDPTNREAADALSWPEG